MNHSSQTVLTYSVKDGVYVHIEYPYCDLLLGVLPDYFKRHVSGSRNSYSSVIPFDEIPSGDREPSYFVFESISLGIAELEQRRVGIY